MVNSFLIPLGLITLLGGILYGYNRFLGEMLRSKADFSGIALVIYLVSIGVSSVQHIGAGLAILAAFLDTGLLMVLGAGFYRLFKWVDEKFHFPFLKRGSNG